MRPRAHRLVAVLIAGVLPSLLKSPTDALAQTTADAFNLRWRERGLVDHALVGKVWSARESALVEVPVLNRRLSSADFLLLGEVHDNADAHTLQGWAIRQHAAIKPGAAVVFEHIRTDQAPALERLEEFDRTARRPATAHDLMRLLDWKRSGWPSEDTMLGLFEAVFHPRLPIYPASPPREQVRAVARGEAAVLSQEERARLGLDNPLDIALSEALTAELKESHCGMLPDTALPAMSVAQRYRDAAFADAMVTAGAKHGTAILAAGNGHVRTDRGVPWHLRRRAPDRQSVAVMMLEVEEGKEDPDTYVPRAPDGQAAVDFIVFTPRAMRTDPCADLRQRMPAKN